MKIRFNHNFLAVVGSALILGSIFIHGSLIASFLGGFCFGIIFFDMYSNRK
jgi:hypothetical protein